MLGSRCCQRAAARLTTIPRTRFSRSSSSSSGAGGGQKAGKGSGSTSWYSETPAQRLAFQATMVGGVAFIGYGLFRAWTDYLDPFASQKDEELVASIPLIKGNPVVFFDLAVNGEAAGRVVFQLRKDVAPRTVENFRRLCTGEPGFGYAGTRVHAVVPGSYLRGGDITHGTGLGGRSSNGGVVPDEEHTLRHVGPGVLSMVSPGGPGNATSQFYIAMARSPFMDYQNLVFGNVIAGMESLKAVEERVKTLGGAMVTISKCGEIRYDPDSPQAHHQPERA